MYDLTKSTWCKGTYAIRDVNTGHPYVMCLAFAVFGDNSYSTILTNSASKARHATLLENIIREHFPERLDDYDAGLSAVVIFNDHPQTTYADVEKVYTEFKRRLEFLEER